MAKGNDLLSQQTPRRASQVHHNVAAYGHCGTPLVIERDSISALPDEYLGRTLQRTETVV
eukprot:5781348-Amphidinium_carterae.1